MHYLTAEAINSTRRKPKKTDVREPLSREQLTHLLTSARQIKDDQPQMACQLIAKIQVRICDAFSPGSRTSKEICIIESVFTQFVKSQTTLKEAADKIWAVINF